MKLRIRALGNRNVPRLGKAICPFPFAQTIGGRAPIPTARAAGQTTPITDSAVIKRRCRSAPQPLWPTRYIGTGVKVKRSSTSRASGAGSTKGKWSFVMPATET